jgi:hypothetical protein
MTLQSDSDEVAALKAERAKLDKKIKRAEKDAEVNARVDSWLKMESYKNELNALQAKYSFSEKELSNCPYLYKYRDDKKRTNDANADWVKSHINAGGSLLDLEQNARAFLERKAKLQLADEARQRRLAQKARAAKKNNDKNQNSKNSDGSNKSSKAKGNAKRSDGGVDKKGIGVGSTL